MVEGAPTEGVKAGEYIITASYSTQEVVYKGEVAAFTVEGDVSAKDITLEKQQPTTMIITVIDENGVVQDALVEAEADTRFPMGTWIRASVTKDNYTSDERELVVRSQKYQHSSLHIRELIFKIVAEVYLDGEHIDGAHGEIFKIVGSEEVSYGYLVTSDNEEVWFMELDPGTYRIIFTYETETACYGETGEDLVIEEQDIKGLEIRLTKLEDIQ